MRSLTSLFRINLADQTDRNAWYLCVEIFWATFLAGAGTFNAAYALHLGATNFHIGLLSSIPSLLAVVISIGAGIFFQHTRRAMTWILGSLTTNRLGYLLLVGLPLLGLVCGKANLGFLAVVFLITLGVPVTFASLGFTDMIAGSIPVDRRASVFATRNIIYFVTLSVSTFGMGYWLGKVTFPQNYQVMYLVTILLSMISIYYIAKVKRPELHDQETAAAPAFSLSSQWQVWRSAFRGDPAFIRLVTNYILYAIGAWIAGPLYTLYFIKQLGATDTWIGWNGTISYVAMVVGYAVWRKILPRWGEQAALRRSIICLGLYPVVVAIWPSLNFILVVGGFYCLLAPGTDLSQLTLLMKVLPEKTRPQFLGLYTALINMVAMFCPLIGVSLAGWIGLRPVLVICGVLSIVGSVSYWVWPIKVKDEGLAKG